MGLKYEPALDGLRAVAALLVVLVHVGAAGVEGGRIGVDVFFVLSGYLITHILTAEHREGGRIDLARFFIRRFKRLAPALLAMLAVFWAVTALRYPALRSFTDRDVILAGTYSSNVLAAYGWRSPILHTWSLAVEMQFYLLWPLVLLVLLRFKRPAIACLVLWAAMSLGRVLEPNEAHAFYLPQYHASGLVLGAAVALWRSPPKASWLGFVGMAAIVGLATLRVPAVNLIAPAEIAAAFVILSPPRLLAAPPLVWAGRFAYGTYLWHTPLWYHLGEPTGWGPAILVYAMASAAGAASYFTVERLLWRPRRSREDARVGGDRPAHRRWYRIPAVPRPVAPAGDVPHEGSVKP